LAQVTEGLTATLSVGHMNAELIEVI